AGHLLRGAVRRRRVEHRSAVLEHGLEHAADGFEILALRDRAERRRAAEPDDGQPLVRPRNRLRDERPSRLGAQQARLERQGRAGRGAPRQVLASCKLRFLPPRRKALLPRLLPTARADAAQRILDTGGSWVGGGVPPGLLRRRGAACARRATFAAALANALI